LRRAALAVAHECGDLLDELCSPGRGKETCSPLGDGKGGHDGPAPAGRGEPPRLVQIATCQRSRGEELGQPRGAWWVLSIFRKLRREADQTC
jgi:hypothetical protein